MKQRLKAGNLIIGSLHFKPLLGYKGFTSIPDVLNTALKDLRAFEQGGVNSIIVENNYDIPHKTNVDPETIAIMTYLTKKIIDNTKLPIGISVLWNDYKAALSIAKVCGAKFIRIPVFVDSVKNKYNETILANPKDVIEYRKKIKAEDILIFTDIQVKHATILNERPISESVKDAIENKSDAIIITGKWTGDAPPIDQLKQARDSARDFPILVGSGANEENITNILQYANGVIVSTSLKEGSTIENEINIKSVDQRVDNQQVRNFIQKVKNERT
jgi:uncharacterized protein